MRSLFVISCLFLLQPVLFAQDRDTLLITPGDSFLRSDQLRDYHVNYDFISLKDGVETKVGGLEDHFHIFSAGKEKQGLRVCHITFGPNNILDSGLCILQGLKPVYHRSIQTKKRIRLDFNNALITGNISTDNNGVPTQETVNYSAPMPLFDSYYEDIIAKTLPFRKDLWFRFAEYIYERGGTVWSTGEVMGKEDSQSGAGAIWKVVLWEKNSEGKVVRTTTYFIRENDRQIVSREYQTEKSRMLMIRR